MDFLGQKRPTLRLLRDTYFNPYVKKKNTLAKK
jgi:hypothetical protein